MTTNQKGAVAELAIALEASRLGIAVRPLIGGARYDLVFDWGGKLERVQCKWARHRGDVIAIQTGGNYHSPTRGYVRSTYAVDEVDAVAAYCLKTRKCYYLPIDEVAGLGLIHLRLNPPRNSQRAGIRMASQFDLGAIAQLGECLTGSQEVGGSSPPGSTETEVTPNGRSTVGSVEFHRRFGWYTRRVAAGERLLVTRCGKPYFRVHPAIEQPIVQGTDPTRPGSTA